MSRKTLFRLSCSSTPSGSQLAEMEKKKKNLASCVIHYLMPYYRDQKIETKELFKGLARKISHKFFEADVTGRSQPRASISFPFTERLFSFFLVPPLAFF